MKKKWEYLESYIESYKKNGGIGELPGLLPKLVIYFRYAFEKLGIYDSYVPIFFSWDEYNTEDFLTWGHNSRWAHTFNRNLYCNLKKYTNKLKREMNANGIKDFKLDIEG